MTENLPDEELTVVGEEPDAVDESIAPEALDPVKDGQPDSYPTAAENNPDNWQQDPLLQDEPGAGAGLEESDQSLRDETEEARFREGEEQVPPEEPTIGEAAADVDFGEPMSDEEVDASDDGANFGGSPLSQFEPEDLDR
ncbi:hypothetical protein SAMN04488693_105215 [Arthrobacter subterraneus]|uniref:DUF5709 domain-containing protein n=1 Tax=Arthrobacter subterraneus TaxID=335973 RepID=A0A1G8HI57_9MICC|nr:hypothetical protein [Arthrobacter subterraneus]SDI06346.1 hypothetical protein SAMN04488693_105215 [Arthrobacter subterraneus]